MWRPITKGAVAPGPDASLPWLDCHTPPCCTNAGHGPCSRPGTTACNQGLHICARGRSLFGRRGRPSPPRSATAEPRDRANRAWLASAMLDLHRYHPPRRNSIMSKTILITGVDNLLMPLWDWDDFPLSARVHSRGRPSCCPRNLFRQVQENRTFVFGRLRPCLDGTRRQVGKIRHAHRHRQGARGNAGVKPLSPASVILC